MDHFNAADSMFPEQGVFGHDLWQEFAGAGGLRPAPTHDGDDLTVLRGGVSR